MNRTLRHFGPAAVILAGLLAGCSSSDPVLYTIAPVQGAQRSSAPAVILLQTVGLARYLDRSHIVKSSENNRLDVQSNDWWGEPLGAMLGRILVDELAQRLPQSSVLSETGAVSATPDAVVELDIRRLDEDASGTLILQAQANVTFKAKRPSILRSLNFAVPPAGPTIADQVKASSAALGQLADGLAAMLTGGR